MSVAIVDYGSGNLHSAANAFRRALREGGHHGSVEVTADPDRVANADRIVLPGVGAFADCRRGLYAVDGMVDAITDAAITKGRPFFGICVGMQLMASVGLEHGEHEGLGWIPGKVTVLTPDDPELKVPHMGWNNLAVAQTHPLVDPLEGQEPYFVHSYHLLPEDPAHLLATVSYGGTVSAIVGRDNLIGTQFHPEKSQAVGLGLISRFLGWTP